MRRIAKQLLGMALFGALLFNTACKDDEAEINLLGEQPTITRLSPAEGTVGTELAITGTNFQQGATVLVGTLAAAQVEVAFDTLIYAQVPAGIAANTALAVSVRNPDGGEAVLASAFTAVAPVLSFVNSATKPSGTIGSTVILEGKAFGDVQGEGQVLFSDGAGGTIPAIIASPEDWTNTFILTTVPQGAQDGPVVVKTAIEISNELPFKIAGAAAFSPSAISWNVTTSLPGGLSGHQAVYVPLEDASGTTRQYVYVSGGRGAGGAASAKVLLGQINENGTIPSWNETQALPAPLSSHAILAATPFNSKVSGSGHLYVLGGADASGAAVSTVAVGSLNSDGTVNNWSAGRALPQPLHSLGAVIFRGAIYIAGGATAGNTPVEKVYKAQIDTLGKLGEWQELPSLPSARAYHGFVSFGGFLYAVGGETAAVTPDDANFRSNDSKLGQIAIAKINIRTGNIAESGWSIAESSLQKARSKHTTLVAGGNIFVSSGLYSAAGQGSSENTYAQINSDGSLSSFGGATGSNTLLSVGGNNLFNQAGISYIDAAGEARVMILGGDDVNSPGVKQQEVIYY